MDMANNSETFFGTFWGCVIGILAFYAFYEPAHIEAIYIFPLVFLIFMAGSAACVFRLTRAYKPEIAVLKSGDADESTAAQDSE